MNETTTSARPMATGLSSSQAGPMHPGEDFVQYLEDYARQRPEVAALWCLGLGFILGWKLKPW
jgi:hypothetical protein